MKAIHPYIAGLALCLTLGACATGRSGPLTAEEYASGIAEGGFSRGSSDSGLVRPVVDQPVGRQSAPITSQDPVQAVLADVIAGEGSTAATAPTPLAASAEPGRPGLFGRLFSRSDRQPRDVALPEAAADPDTGPSKAPVPDAAVAEPALAQAQAVPDATVAAAAQDQAGPEAEPRRPGLFAAVFRPRSDGAQGATPVALPPADAIAEPEVGAGVNLPFGSLAKVCKLRKREMGREVATSEPGQGGFALFDTNATTIAPRTHYLTGFRDGCARQFTAALANFGDATTHEAQRYSAAGKGLPFNAVDRAYEDIRARVCRAPVGTPCPAGRAARLEQNLTFVTLYERFGAGPRTWMDVLLYNGKLVAAETRSR